MSMLDLSIDRLSLHVTGARGHEHRLRPIATRAAAILADRLDERDEQGGQHENLGAARLRGSSVHVDLGRMSDEQAARSIADSWLEAIALQMR